MNLATQRMAGVPFRPRVGTVTSVTLADSVCTVLINEGEVPAYLTDNVWNTVAVGAVVTLLPVGDTYEVISTRTGTTGGGGLILGPEMIPNGGFGYGDTVPTGWAWWPWVQGIYTAARDTTPGQMVSGVARMLVSLTGGTDAPFVNVTTTDPFRIDPGVAYQGSVWVKASAVEASLVTDMYVITAPTAAGAGIFGTGAALLSVASVTAPGAAYQYLAGPVTVPTGHLYARAFLRCTAAASIGTIDVSWDEASLRRRITS